MLGLKGRRVLLSIHLLLAGIWIGSLISVLFLYYANTSLSGEQQANINLAIFRINDNLIINVSLLMLITGLLFSLFTKWEFFKFRWIVSKWAGISLLALLILFFSAPAINTLAAISDIKGAAGAGDPGYRQAAQNSAWSLWIQLALLISIVVISVFKPWGQRRQRFKLNRKALVTLGAILGAVILTNILVQYFSLRQYRQLPIADVDLAALSNGVYIGEAQFGFRYAVAVEMKDRRIDQVKIIRNRDSRYARLAEGVLGRVLRRQTPNVRAVTGATTTSKVLMKAIENALQHTGSD